MRACTYSIKVIGSFVAETVEQSVRVGSVEDYLLAAERNCWIIFFSIIASHSEHEELLFNQAFTALKDYSNHMRRHSLIIEGMMRPVGVSY